jgi:hypothetical protein
MKDMKSLMEMLKAEEGSGSEMTKDRIEAKMQVLKELLDMAEDREADQVVGGLKKVTVAAPDDASLKQGLEKAEEIVDDMPKEDDMMEMDEDLEDEEEVE